MSSAIQVHEKRVHTVVLYQRHLKKELISHLSLNKQIMSNLIMVMGKVKSKSSTLSNFANERIVLTLELVVSLPKIILVKEKCQ